MKKRKFIFVFLVSLVGILLVWGCRKKSPEGPTDIRIRNLTTQIFDSVYVDTYSGDHTYGTILPASTTGYERYDKAYREAYIKLYINQVKYELIPVDYTYEIPIGQEKCTYELSIADSLNHTLGVHVVLDAPL
ncbi:MAG: hypothetical protein KAX05_05315 [Bacteroidales bacterium]|nr:hypothetical protein [Bacteroidales bacterium]